MVFSHRIKRTTFLNRHVGIVLQNENGPCPLLSIANVLILQGILKIHPDRSEITSEQLIERIGAILIDRNPPLKDESLRKNQQQTLDDIMAILPTMEDGLDVNVRFDKVSSFEYDTRISVFDMLGVNLYHGWIADPNDDETYAVVGRLSYNQLVDRIIEADSKAATKLIKPKPIPKEKVDDSSSLKGEEDEEKKEEQAQDKDQDPVEENVDIAKDDEEKDTNEVVFSMQDAPIQTEELLEQEKEEDPEEEAKEEDMSSSNIENNSEDQGKNIETASSTETTDLQESSGDSAEGGGEEAQEETEEVKELKREAKIAQQFLKDTASQLTYLGLTELHQNVEENNLCVFFRNNHFSTMFRKDGDLYLLLTDAGYEKQHSVAWERLDEINGDTEMVSPSFEDPSQFVYIPAVTESDNMDRQLAIQLQQAEHARVTNAQRAAPQRPPGRPPVNARYRTQEERYIEEQRIALEAYKRLHKKQQKKKGGCVLS